jgi:hypothetical protein
MAGLCKADGEIRNANTILVDEAEEKKSFGNLGVHRTVIFEGDM